VLAAVAVLDPPEDAATIPKAPPPSAAAASPAAIHFVSLFPENMGGLL
jgi:hypothetical protein